MNIPYKAVEAVLDQYGPFLNGIPPEDIDDGDLAALRDEAREILELAAPFIRAEALREFAAQVVHDDPDDDRWRWETSDVADAARAYARELDPS